jgi:epoxyqueuosine reductase
VAAPPAGPRRPPVDPAVLKRRLRARAAALGFAKVGVAPATLPAKVEAGYRGALARGWHGEMAWLARMPARRAQPQGLWPAARSVIVLAMNYGPASDPRASLARRRCGTISAYARHRDYHDVVKGRLKQLGQWLQRETGADLKVFVDTAPVLEKPLARAAGLGWQGKHTNLVARDFGSWLFLGEIFTDLDLPPDAPAADRCGSCRACLDACPTAAFPAPYQLDARRCISYLTIEHPGHIPPEFRGPIGNRIYGCDDCLAVCPWNKFASVAREAKLQARPDLEAPDLAELAGLDDAAFRKHFAGSPIKRIGRDRFLRNVLIALGNSGAPELAPQAVRHLRDPSPLVRAMAVWALGRLLDHAGLARLAATHRPAEADPAVLAEWRRACP